MWRAGGAPHSRPRCSARRAEEGSAERGAGTAGKWKRAPEGSFGDLTLEAVMGGGAVPMRLISGRIPKNLGAPAPPRQPPHLRDATVQPIKGASLRTPIPARHRGSDPRGSLFRPSTRPKSFLFGGLTQGERGGAWSRCPLAGAAAEARRAADAEGPFPVTADRRLRAGGRCDEIGITNSMSEATRGRRAAIEAGA